MDDVNFIRKKSSMKLNLFDETNFLFSYLYELQNAKGSVIDSYQAITGKKCSLDACCPMSHKSRELSLTSGASVNSQVTVCMCER